MVKNFRHDLVNPEEILRTEDRGLQEAKEVVEDALSLEVEGADPLFPELLDGDLLEGVDRMPDPNRGDGKPGKLGPAAIVVDSPPRSRLKGKGPSIRPQLQCSGSWSPPRVRRSPMKSPTPKPRQYPRHKFPL